MAIIQAFQNSGFYLIQEIEAFQNSDFHYSNAIQAYNNSEFKYTTFIQAYGNSEFHLFTADVYDTLTFGVAGTPTIPASPGWPDAPGSTPEIPGTEYLEFIQPIVCFNLGFSGGTNYSPFVKDLKFTRSLEGKTYCDLTLVEYGDGVITDLVSDLGLGLAGDKIVSLQPSLTNPLSLCSFPLKPHNFDDSRYFVLALSVGYPGSQFATYYSCNMIPSQVSFDGTECTLKLEDYSAILEIENRNITPDIDADNGVKKSAYAAVREMVGVYSNVPAATPALASVVLKKFNVVFGYSDFQIRLLRRTQGRPLDWIDKISNIPQAKRKWMGMTMFFTPTMTADEQPAKWSLLGHKHITEGSFKLGVDLSRYRNKFTIIRTSSNGGVIGEQECIGYDCPGRTGNITFDFPVNYASATVEVTNGGLENFVYFTPQNTPAGNPYWPGGLAYQGVLVNNVKFTYRANIGTTSTQDQTFKSDFGAQLNLTQIFGYTPRYRVTYRGKASGGDPGIDSDYKFTVQDTDGIACLGLREDYGDIEDSIIPNSSSAFLHASAVLKESTRKVFTLSLDTPFVNPFIETGDCIAITDFETKMNSLKWLVEEVTISISGNDANMSLSLSRGRT